MKTKILTTEGTLSYIREVTSTKFGTERKFWVLIVNNKDYFMFQYPNLRPGSYVKITFKQNGSFRDIISIKHIPRTLNDFTPRTPEEFQQWLRNIKEALK